MVKALEFWKFICENKNYRLFSGVPCIDFKALYDKMSAQFMHYIPAVNEHSAFGISLGAASAGVKSGVLIDYRYLRLVNDWIAFCKEHSAHILILTNDLVNCGVNELVFSENYEELSVFIDKNHAKNKPAMVVLKGVL